MSKEQGHNALFYFIIMDAFIDPALVQDDSYETGAQNGAEFDAQVKHEDDDIKAEPEETQPDDEEMQDLFGDDDADEKQEDSAQEEHQQT